MICTNCKTNNIYASTLCKNCYEKENSKNQYHKDGKWSDYSDQCKDCSTTSKPHHSWGFCTACYARQRRKYKRIGLTSKDLSVALRKRRPKLETRNLRHNTCKLCRNGRAYSYSGTYLPVCINCYPSWRKTVPCDGCSIPCLENAVETESDDGVIYWWHRECWLRACSEEQKQQLIDLAKALSEPPQRDSSHVSTP